MLDPTLLRTLAAVIHTGSFDHAAQDLSVTPSAVSQRIRQLEDRLGSVLVIRGQPALATPTGRRLIRHADEVDLLERALGRDLAGLAPERGRATVRIAVNADSLALWFIDALSQVDDTLFHVVTDDQDHSADWLKRGEVMAAVTAHPGPVQGADSLPIGVLRYVATSSPEFARRHFPNGVDAGALTAAPALTFDRKDGLQRAWAARETGKRPYLVTHMLPSTRGFVDAAIAGMGWGMNPEPLVRDDLHTGRLVALGRDPIMDVALYWQSSRSVRGALAPLRRAVQQTARKKLLQPAP